MEPSSTSSRRHSSSSSSRSSPSSWSAIVIVVVTSLTLINLRTLVEVSRQNGFEQYLSGDLSFFNSSSITISSSGSSSIAWKQQIDDMMMGLPSLTTLSSKSKKVMKKPRVAYAVSVTKCVLNEYGRSTLDRAAVLHQSIKVAHGHPITTPSRTSRTWSPKAEEIKYEFHMHAFIHLNASDCVPFLEQLGYITHVRDTPIHTSEMPPNLAQVQHNSCCGDLEWSKLYTYLLTEYPVATHLDLDTIMLKPMDDVYDLIIDQSHDYGDNTNSDFHRYNRTRFVTNRENAMWIRDEDKVPKQVDFVFTRDYNMVNPPSKQVHQIGVQGGFLVVRPNITEFERLREIVRQGGDFELHSGWGGKTKGFGGYFGAGTIQGLASYYYSDLSPNRSVEVNRCYYNTMVDSPYHQRDNRTLCRTLEPDGTCEDCRRTPISKIYTAHFTCCGKPEWCNLGHPIKLCRSLFSEWHRIRLSLEEEWVEKFGPNGVVSNITSYDPKLEVIPYNITDENDRKLLSGRGHCKRQGGYSKLAIPNVEDRLM
mmetsp:Transcript_30167/g.73330  ORF Transcript_30167/g.73330 Transcript_30167/m.73330 type:complete len:535 (+) Transcript_30167:200-1804(+)